MSVAPDLLDGFMGTSEVSRYDLLLALLPLPLCLGVATSFLLGAPTSLGVGVGGLPSALLLGYALFFDAPVPDGRGRRGRTRGPGRTA